MIKDLGENTISMYSEFIREAKIVVMRGPAGVVEDNRFKTGTQKLLEAAVNSNGFVLIAGGQLGSMIEKPAEERIHLSTGGNALLLFLSGGSLPTIKALELSAKMFLSK